MSGCEQNFFKEERRCDWTASWRAQFVKTCTKIELQSFKQSDRRVEHVFDSSLRWKFRLRKRDDEERTVVGSGGRTLPIPSDPADDRIFSAPPSRDWTKRQKRQWREFRKFENLRNPEGEPSETPGSYECAGRPPTDTGCIRVPNSADHVPFVLSADAKLPAVIFMYWEQGWEAAPPSVRKSAEKAQCILEGTQWKLYFFDEQTVVRHWLSYFHRVFYESVRDHISCTARSDLIRLILLHERGGVWCDASNVLTDDLRWLSRIFDERAPEIFAFTSPHQDTVIVNGCQVPLLENWFIACVGGCKLIDMWLKEFKGALLDLKESGSSDGYIKYAESKSISFHRMHTSQYDYRSYLLMHTTQQVLLQRSDVKIPQLKIETLPSIAGPFLLHSKFSWQSEKIIAAILNIDEGAHKSLEVPPYFIKLRGDERAPLDRRIRQGRGDNMRWLLSCRVPLNYLR